MTRDERGSGSVLALLVVTVLAITAVVGSQVVGLSRLQHRAASAADLAALAASQAAVAGSTDACAAADEVAARNAARMVECDLSGLVATVEVVVESPRWWGERWSVGGRGRAAPDDHLPAGSSGDDA